MADLTPPVLEPCPRKRLASLPQACAGRWKGFPQNPSSPEPELRRPRRSGWSSPVGHTRARHRLRSSRRPSVRTDPDARRRRATRARHAPVPIHRRAAERATAPAGPRPCAKACRRCIPAGRPARRRPGPEAIADGLPVLPMIPDGAAEPAREAHGRCSGRDRTARTFSPRRPATDGAARLPVVPLRRCPSLREELWSLQAARARRRCRPAPKPSQRCFEKSSSPQPAEPGVKSPSRKPCSRPRPPRFFGRS
jgi:hypothetical protein